MVDIQVQIMLHVKKHTVTLYPNGDTAEKFTSSVITAIGGYQDGILYDGGDIPMPTSDPTITQIILFWLVVGYS